MDRSDAKNYRSERFNVEIPCRCSEHQCVKGSAHDPDDQNRRCIFCDRYTMSLKTQTCLDCLSTEHLVNFKLERVIASDPKYSWLHYLAGRESEHRDEEQHRSGDGVSRADGTISLLETNSTVIPAEEGK